MKIDWFPVVTDSIERQREEESKRQRVKKTKRQKVKETKSQRGNSQRDKESKRERDGGSILAWSAVRLQRCIRMAKMQGAEDEGAGSVLKYMTKPESDSNEADWLL